MNRLVSAALACWIPVAGAAGSLEPFTAEYEIRWSALRADLTMQLETADPGNEYVYRVVSEARGLAKLIRSGTAVEQSRFRLTDDGVRSLHYELDDGSRVDDSDMRIEFDWDSGTASSTYEKETVELELEAGVRDRLSTDIVVMQALREGNDPGPFRIAEKNQIRDYQFTFEGKETVEVPAGTFDTLRYLRQRIGSSRSTRIWFAPAVNYLPVKLEQLKRGDPVLTTVATRLPSG